MNYRLRSRDVLLWGGSLLLFLNLGNAAAEYLLLNHPSALAHALEALFSFDREANPPALFNGLLLLVMSLLALLTAHWRQRNRLGQWQAWAGAGLLLGFMFADEVCAIHDSMDSFLDARVDTSGAFSWPWVIVYGALTVLVGFLYLPFFIRLAPRHRMLFALAGGMYVAGAIGMEMISAGYIAQHGDASVASATYAIFVAIEENLEMLACLLAIAALIDYLRHECPGFHAVLRTEE